MLCKERGEGGGGQENWSYFACEKIRKRSKRPMRSPCIVYTNRKICSPHSSALSRTRIRDVGLGQKNIAKWNDWERVIMLYLIDVSSKLTLSLPQVNFCWGVLHLVENSPPLMRFIFICWGEIFYVLKEFPYCSLSFFLRKMRYSQKTLMKRNDDFRHHQRFERKLLNEICNFQCWKQFQRGGGRGR